MPNSVLSYGRVSPKMEEYDSHRSPDSVLMDMVAHLQLEVEKFSGETSWEQYRQMFDAIVRSNG